MSSDAPQTPVENQSRRLAIQQDASEPKPSSQCRRAQRFHLHPHLEPSTPPRARSLTPVTSNPTQRARANQEQTTGTSRIRSPSTSPPPEPPAQQFMIAGPSGDDRYRMVEDELLHTARRFTTHLHRAEYARLKKLAATQNAAAIREMQRPVVPGLVTATATATAAANRRREAASRTARRRGGSGLQGLMETPRGREARLGPSLRPRAAGVSAASPGQRLASSSAGVGGGRDRVEGEEQEEEEVDDDPFGVRERRVRREKSREQMRRTAGRETQTPTKPEKDTIPWFF